MLLTICSKPSAYPQPATTLFGLNSRHQTSQNAR